MKKISYYLIFVVIVGGILISFLAYQKYFKERKPTVLLFNVERGSIQEAVKVRGEVVPQKDFDLEFPFSGTVEMVFVREGQQVGGGDPLMGLETTDFELEIQKLQAQLAQAEADVAVQEVALANYYQSISNILDDAYTKANDAVRKQVDEMFSNDENNPQLTFVTADSQAEIDTEFQRSLAGKALDEWRSESGNPDKTWTDAGARLVLVRDFLDRLADAVNGSVNISPVTLATYKANINTARTNINAVLTDITNQEQSINLQKAKVKSYKANVLTAKTQIAIVQEKIKKSTLHAPGAAKVVKVWFEKGELFVPGQTAVSLSAEGHKIEADVSELEIGKVRETDGNEVLIKLDSFPNLNLKGKVVSIEPKEIIKEGDKYYRISVYVEPHGPEIRSGMTADLVIRISSKDSVLKIPEFAISQKDGKEFVTIIEGNEQKETEIETGISDGESIEVVKGLTEGQTIVVSAE